ncbi:hypothetical protein RHMOL_Rhmol01G0014400 [Rhododendron molle]|uniref:Uncharacterized protein n=1 Tax=Rhododendron molle TaxID=49168 RepID=A0ACC0PX73_RHOML|nr:hypothetical protein RHMOL_Rhmol01G0014400 [Rhododendron molle]
MRPRRNQSAPWAHPVLTKCASGAVQACPWGASSTDPVRLRRNLSAPRAHAP